MNTFEGFANEADGFEESLEAVSSAAAWLAKQTDVLFGDDSVGWWLLIHCSYFPEDNVVHRMLHQLKNFLSRPGIRSSQLYAISAIARTLHRLDPSILEPAILEELGRFLGSEYQRLLSMNPTNLSEGLVWVLQTSYELDLLEDLEPRRGLTDLVTGKPISDQAVQVAMIWPIIQSNGRGKVEEIQNSLSEHIRAQSADELGLLLDWQVSYFLHFSIDVGAIDLSDRLTTYLLGRQVDSQWDEEFEENLESTSLVGIALLREFLEKGRALEAVVPLVFRLLQCAVMTPRRAVSLTRAFAAVKNTKDPQKRGELFEKFIEKFIENGTEWSVYDRRRRTSTGEVDLVAVSRAAEALLKATSYVLLIECRYRKKRVSSKDIRDFDGKIDSTSSLTCNLGLIISMAGFTKDSMKEVDRINSDRSSRGRIIMTLDGAELSEALNSARTFDEIIAEKAVSASV